MNTNYEISMSRRMPAAVPAASRETINRSDLVQVELINLLERTRCEYYALLNSEPDEESLLTYFQWQDEIAGLRSKMFRLKELLAVA